MTHNLSSSVIISLQDVLNYQDDWFLLHLSYPDYKPHPHQTFLIWLLKYTTPNKIAIFDNTSLNTQTFVCSLTHALGIGCLCYGNTKELTYNLFPKTLIPLTPEASFTNFSIIYIDISNQEIKNDPLLSTIDKNIPNDTIFVFNNLYSSSSIALANRKLIRYWQQSYSNFEFSHHQGLLVLYTGKQTNINALNDLFSLKHHPKSEQIFKTQCALLDEYWQLKINSIQKVDSNKNIKAQIIETKAQAYLLQQKAYYKEKQYQEKIKHINDTAEAETKLLQIQINHLYKKVDYIQGQYQKRIEHITLDKNRHIDYITLKQNKKAKFFLTNYQEKLKQIELLATKDLESFKTTLKNNETTTITYFTAYIKQYHEIHHNYCVWQENTQQKISNIQNLLNKYSWISRFFSKKLKQQLTFSPPPDTTLPKLVLPPEQKIPECVLHNFFEAEAQSQNHCELLNQNLLDPLNLSSQQIDEQDSYHPLEEAFSPQDFENDIPAFPTEPPIIDNPYRPRRVVFVAGEPNTPGVIYRCERNAAACIMAGHEAKVINAANVSPDDIRWADILILWRVEFSGHILGIVEVAKEFNTLTAFDADDIVFKPHFAYIEIIDGIRTIGTTESETSRTFGNMKQTLMRTDFAVATTQEMREHMAQELIPKHAGPLVFILPNIFDDDCVRISRFYSRIQKASKNDEYVRIGYASGTRTHQRDFALVIPALLTIFKKRPQVKLVLFREPENHRPILHMNEFPELNDFQDRIEWRDTVPLKQLPKELARFDISIAPLEADNVFCNAKSELKFFEAALANVCSVVSPTGPLTRCIQPGITGLIAKNSQEWEQHLLTLIDDPVLRQKMAQNAYHDVLWNFSTQRQSHLCDTILLSLINEKQAAQAMETMIARKEYKNLSNPIIPESEILFEHDALQESEVTVVITSYNYSKFIIEAMESVKVQTLNYIDMIIVDDGSSDDSIELIIAWAQEHKNRFNRLQLHRSLKNAGLGGARNIGIAASETLYSMQLDADNRLLPDSCEKLLAKIQNTSIGYAYPHLHHFGAGNSIGGHIPFHPLRLTVGNYIDAMVMLAKWAWSAAGGYYVQRDAMGWEDYDIWCRLAELGIQGTQVKDAIAEYRAHTSSMTNTVTEQAHHKPKVTSYVSERHPWVQLVMPEASPWIKRNKD